MNIVRLAIVGKMTVALVCAVVAAMLAYTGKDGWGWFLFVALCLGDITASSKSVDQKKD